MASELASPVTTEERHARMVMSRIAEPGDVDACALVHAHGALALFDRLAAHSLEVSHSKVGGWADRLRVTSAEEMRRLAEREDARFICPGDPEWPQPLDDLAAVAGGRGDRRGGAPFGLWVRGGGDLSHVANQSVAIVGARAATAYGEHVAGDLAAGCSIEGWTVVSGGAYGIDAAAHRGALAVGRATVSVMAGGVDRLYPAGHAPLLRRILDLGCLVSEAAPGCAPSKARFLVRNRLIAALTLGTVVVEAAFRSGSLNTARWADDLGRAVMGVPGPVTSAASRGVHQILRGETAVLVTAADEVIEHLAPIGTALAARREAPTQPVDRLDRDARQILDAVPRRQSASTASIALTAGLARHVVGERLVALAQSGWVTRSADGAWRLADADATGNVPGIPSSGCQTDLHGAPGR